MSNPTRPGEYDKDLEEFSKEPETKTPYEKWLKALEEVKLTEKEAEKILDAYLQKGFWEKEYILFKGRLKICLRTRDGYHGQRIANALDSLRTNDPAIHAQTLFRLNLAASLSKYKDTSFDFPKYVGNNSKEVDDAFNKRLTFIDTEIGELVVNQLFMVVDNFDKLTRAVFSDGAASGFLDQTQE